MHNLAADGDSKLQVKAGSWCIMRLTEPLSACSIASSRSPKLSEHPVCPSKF